MSDKTNALSRMIDLYTGMGVQFELDTAAKEIVRNVLPRINTPGPFYLVSVARVVFIFGSSGTYLGLYDSADTTISAMPLGEVGQ